MSLPLCMTALPLKTTVSLIQTRHTRNLRITMLFKTFRLLMKLRENDLRSARKRKRPVLRPITKSLMVIKVEQGRHTR